MRYRSQTTVWQTVRRISWVRDMRNWMPVEVRLEEQIWTV